MFIKSIDSIFKDDSGRVYVTAVLDESVQIYPQTYYDPAEYGPAVCQTSFYLDDGENIPDDEQEMINFIENLDLEWLPVDLSDEYF